VVVAMGRKTGHLALGIGKSASATLTLIPEEFKSQITLKLVVDTIAGSIIKRLAEGRNYGVAVVAEGFLEFLRAEELESLVTDHQKLEYDEHGHLRLSELNF
jgi:6-phosphofructokinase 1